MYPMAESKSWQKLPELDCKTHVFCQQNWRKVHIIHCILVVNPRQQLDFSLVRDSCPARNHTTSAILQMQKMAQLVKNHSWKQFLTPLKLNSLPNGDVGRQAFWEAWPIFRGRTVKLPGSTAKRNLGKACSYVAVASDLRISLFLLMSPYAHVCFYPLYVLLVKKSFISG